VHTATKRGKGRPRSKPEDPNSAAGHEHSKSKSQKRKTMEPLVASNIDHNLVKAEAVKLGSNSKTQKSVKSALEELRVRQGLPALKKPKLDCTSDSGN
jgi:hypothetical protein